MSVFFVSFVGSLPLGTLNMTAFQISASKGIKEAVIFSIAVIIVELFVVRITLIGNDKIKLRGKALFYLFPPAVIFLIYLALSNFFSSNDPEAINITHSFVPGISSPFLLGTLLSLLNPLAIPFWIGWNEILLSKKILKKSMESISAYILGIGSGTFIGLLVFIFFGSKIVENFDVYSNYINMIMGILYVSIAVYLSFMFYKKYLKSKNRIVLSNKPE